MCGVSIYKEAKSPPSNPPTHPLSLCLTVQWTLPWWAAPPALDRHVAAAAAPFARLATYAKASSSSSAASPLVWGLLLLLPERILLVLPFFLFVHAFHVACCDGGGVMWKHA